MSRQLLLDVLPAPAPSLENYIPGPNIEALQAANDLAPGRALYLWGADGSGRSHLLRGLTSLPGLRHYFPAAGSTDILRQLADSDGRHADLIAIDDVQQLDEAAQAVVFALYNRWRESAASPHAFSLVLAGDRAPLSMPLREDLRTRLGWDLVFRLEPLSDADKLAALQLQAESRGVNLTPEVLKWILTHLERDMRKLSRLIDELDRYSLSARRPITIPLLRTMLADPNTNRQ